MSKLLIKTNEFSSPFYTSIYNLNTENSGFDLYCIRDQIISPNYTTCIDFEKEFPELVSIKPDKNLANIKAINYLEIIPLLVNKIQIMQKEIDELKEKMSILSEK